MKTMAQKVVAKNAIKPEATPISKLANQPKSPSGTPNRVPARVVWGTGCAVVGGDCVIQVE
jgi:hypothetical protein